jgi:hypothetical protein
MGPIGRRVRDHHERQREQDGGQERRANLAVCDGCRDDGHDPSARISRLAIGPFGSRLRPARTVLGQRQGAGGWQSP